MPLPAFHFKKFSVAQEGAAHSVGTDAVLLGAWADLRGTRHFLDIGTGTGVVALMLAQRISDINLSDPQIWNAMAVEIHPPSAALARANFAACPWADQMQVWEGPIQEFVHRNKESMQISWPNAGFDLIVSNPPFFSELTISPNQTRSLGRHTATLSPGDLLACVSQLLAPHGRFCAILPEREGRQLCELAVSQGLYWTRITQVHSRPERPVERLLLQFEKSPYAIQREGISIYSEKTGHGYSTKFQELTRDFYLAG